MSLRSRWLLAVVPVVVACGGDAGPTFLEHEVYPDAGEDGNEDAGEGEPDASKRRDGGNRPTFPYDGGIPDDGTFDPDAACAASAVAAEQVVVTEQVEVQVPIQVEVQVPAPVALYVMFDRSASMGSGVLLSPGSHQWAPAVAAVKSFVRDPDSSGMEVGLQYFPSGGGQCGGAGYNTPAVATKPLPANVGAIESSLNATSPAGAEMIGTPIEGALNGIQQYCRRYKADRPDVDCIGVLVTDGRAEWTSCREDDASLVKIAENAWKNDKVRIFTVGLKGADFNLLDKIAQAGGAADCDTTSTRFSCDVSSSADKLNVALAKVRDTIVTYKTEYETQYKTVTNTVTRPLACTWNMPVPAEGVAVDKTKVNVTVGGNGVSLPLGKVPSESSCRIGGWFFDDPVDPKQIVACPETCQAITASKATDVQIQLGCETQILVI